MFETLPQLVVQNINNYYSQQFGAIAVFSNVLSCTMALNGVYRYGYWSLYKGVNFYEVMTVALKA